jgi:hypothetical protein
LDYNPSYLTVSGAQLAAGISGTLSVTNTTPGVLLVSITGFSSTAAAGAIGGTDIVDISASVPAAAISSYGASSLLKVVNPLVNGAAIPISDALEKVVYFGDVSGDGRVNAADASLVARNRVHLDSGFSAYALTDPRIIGNVTGNGTLASSDASLIAQVGVHLPVAKIPAIPTHGTLTAAGVDPTVGIPLGIAATAGQTVNVPVSITDNAAGVASADFVIDYNPDLLTLTNSGVTLAAALSNSGWSLITNVDNADGVAYVSLFATSALPAGTPQLLNLAFTVAGNAPSGTTAVSIDPAGIDLNDASGNVMALAISNGSVNIAASQSTSALPWQNAANPLDVNDDGMVTPLDALAIINYIDLHGSAVLPATFSGTDYLDVNGDDDVSPLDALSVINYLNSHASSGAQAAVSVRSIATVGEGSGAARAAVGGVDTSLAMGVSLSTVSVGSGTRPTATAPEVAASAGSVGMTTDSASGSAVVGSSLNQAAVDSLLTSGHWRKSERMAHANAVDAALANSRHKW